MLNVELRESNGYLTSLLDLLWTRDPAFGSVPSIHLPDTIIFSFNQPITWYFSSKGVVKKKSKEKLKCSLISEKFLRKITSCGIIASFVSKRKLGEGNHKYIFEYFDETAFAEFIDDSQIRMRNGVLQRFIEPVPLRGYILPDQIERSIYNIAQHIGNISYGSQEVEILVLNYRLDSKDRLWLLFCSTLQYKKNYSKSRIPGRIEKEHLFDVPDYVDKSKLTFTISKDTFKRVKCFSCDDMKDKDSIYFLKYSSVLDSWKLDHNCETFNTGSRHKNKELAELISMRTSTTKYILGGGELEDLLMDSGKKIPDINSPLLSIIPPLIRRIEPKMTVEGFKNLEKDPGFRNKVLLVCERCYLYYLQSSTYNTNLETIQIRQAFNYKEQIGLGKQKPENLERTRQSIFEKLGKKYIGGIGFSSISSSIRTDSNIRLRGIRGNFSSLEKSVYHPKSQNEIPRSDVKSQLKILAAKKHLKGNLRTSEGNLTTFQGMTSISKFSSKRGSIGESQEPFTNKNSVILAPRIKPKGNLKTISNWREIYSVPSNFKELKQDNKSERNTLIRSPN